MSFREIHPSSDDTSITQSTTELQSGSDGEVALGMIAGSVKLHDVRRDPRVALHSRRWSRRERIPGRVTRSWLAASLRSIRPPTADMKGAARRSGSLDRAVMEKGG